MGKDWDVINIMRHYRHDLLNHMQLINSYLKMGKVEKVQSLIDDLVRQAKNESQLSNLNMPQFTEELLTFNWEDYPFCLSFEVLSKAEDWSDQDKLLLSFFEKVTRLLHEYAMFGDNQKLFVMINDIEEKLVVMDYQGPLNTAGGWEDDLARIKNEFSGKIEELNWNESECYITFFPERAGLDLSEQR